MLFVKPSFYYCFAFLSLISLSQHSLAYQLTCANGIKQTQLGGFDHFKQDWPLLIAGLCQGRSKMNYGDQGWLPNFTNFSLSIARSQQQAAKNLTDAKQTELSYEIAQPIYRFKHVELHGHYGYQQNKVFLTSQQAISFVPEAGSSVAIAAGNTINLESTHTTFGASVHFRPISRNPVDQIYLAKHQRQQPLEINLDDQDTVNPDQNLLLPITANWYQLSLIKSRKPRGFSQSWATGLLFGQITSRAGSVANVYSGSEAKQSLLGLALKYQINYKKRINQNWHWLWQTGLEGLWLTAAKSNQTVEYQLLSQLELASQLSIEARF